jgi:DNA-binding NtrC family response regulator
VPDHSSLPFSAKSISDNDPVAAPADITVEVEGRAARTGDGAQRASAVRSVSLVPNGAFYEHAPFESGEHQRADLQSLKDAETSADYGPLIGASGVMQRIFGLVRRLEAHALTVLLCGEAGTGKASIARTIHQRSAGRSGRYVTVNCAALNRERSGSELFGHGHGTFVAAPARCNGAFHEADAGTLFLDEVAELPLDVQARLLNTLLFGEVLRVGECHAERVDVRVISATRHNLEDLVIQGKFREDLYHRLNVTRLELPPLRERPEDIEGLALLAARGRGVDQLPETLLEELRTRSWPGNVRELMYAIEVYLAVGELPRPQVALRHGGTTPDAIDLSVPYETLKRNFTDSFLATYLRKLISHTGGNVSRAARLSGIERSYLNKLVLQHGLR